MSIYPITGELREILLGFESTIVFFSFQFVILFILKFNRHKANSLELQDYFRLQNKSFGQQLNQYFSFLRIREIAWGALFFLIGLTYMMFILSDFYAGDENTRLAFLYSGYLFFIIGIILLAYSFEKKELKNTRYFFTKTFTIILFLEMISMLVIPWLVLPLGIILWPIIIGMLIKLTVLNYRRSKGLRSLAFPTYSLFIGLMILIFGFLFTTDPIIIRGGLELRLVGDLIEIVGIILCGLSFYFLPTFEEYDWIEKIRQLYIIHSSGISLYSHNFRPKEKQIESDLTTGAIIAIKSMIEEMNLKGKKLESIRKGQFTVLLGYGKYVTIAIFADTDSLSLREKAQYFINAFETKYEKRLVKWFGNTDIFDDADELVRKIFPI